MTEPRPVQPELAPWETACSDREAMAWAAYGCALSGWVDRRLAELERDRPDMRALVELAATSQHTLAELIDAADRLDAREQEVTFPDHDSGWEIHEPEPAETVRPKPWYARRRGPVGGWPGGPVIARAPRRDRSYVCNEGPCMISCVSDPKCLDD